MRFIKKTTILVLLLYFPIFLNANSHNYTIAVLDFHNHSIGSKEKLEPLRYGLADMMISALSVSSQLKVVERQRLKTILKEQALSLSGILDSSSTQKVGKLLGAQYLLLGSFMGVPKDNIRIDCRIVKTESGETVKAAEVSGDIDDLLELLKKLSNKILQNLDVKLSKQERQDLENSLDLCDLTVINDYFKALSFSESNAYREALQLLDEIVKECPQLKRAEELRDRIKKNIQK